VQSIGRTASAALAKLGSKRERSFG
jgi:hypothetical protein